jgi:hypothetical protein
MCINILNSNFNKKLKMSFNPYASEDFNRIKVKSEKDYET